MKSPSPPAPTAAHPRESFWWLGFGLLLTPVAVTIASAVFPHVQLGESAASVGAFAGATLFPIAGLSLAARVEARLAFAFSGAAVAVGLLIALALLHPAPALAGLLVDSALVTLSWSLGCTLGRRVQHASHLLPACVVAACADLVSLLSPEGPSHAIAESERALSVLAVWFPVPASSAWAPALGVGDLLFMGLSFGVARAHALPYARGVMACVVGTALAGGAAAYSGLAIPALVPIAAMLVLTLPAIRKLRRSDRTVALVSMLLAGTVAASTVVRSFLSAH